jgi:serine/threonine-protein kinase
MNQPPPGDTRRTDALCDEFEQGWRGGGQPEIERYLERAGPAGGAFLLRELLALELHYRRARGEQPRPDEYQRRFPDGAAAVAAAFAAPAVPDQTGRNLQTVAAEPPALPVLTLAVVAGPRRGTTFVCTGTGKARIGRGGSAHLGFDDPYVSRAQCQVEAGPAGWRITDLGGRNRTLVNDRPMAANQSADLRSGDRVQAGQTTLLVSLGPPSDPAGRAAEQDTLLLGGNLGAPAEVPATAPPAAMGSVLTTRPPAPGETVPVIEAERLGPYTIERELGRGGMGVVYLARRDGGARVALKTITPAAGYDARQVKMFQREIEILKQLDHHHIVPFLDQGEAAGMLYLAMGYVEGTDANKMLRQGLLPIRTAVGIACQLLSALTYAHQKGFVHRDIKPANVLIAEEGGKKSVKLADFGLARVYQQSQLSGMTREGDVGGTIAFMAPEQITGFRETPPAADQYSAAATLYTLLSGQVPLDFPPNADRLQVVLRSAPVPLLSRRADVPPQLAGIIHRALAKEPAQRFPDVRALRNELKGFA